jgi:hypothetical protein
MASLLAALSTLVISNGSIIADVVPGTLKCDLQLCPGVVTRLQRIQLLPSKSALEAISMSSKLLRGRSLIVDHDASRLQRPAVIVLMTVEAGAVAELDECWLRADLPGPYDVLCFSAVRVEGEGSKVGGDLKRYEGWVMTGGNWESSCGTHPTDFPSFCVTFSKQG